MDYSKKATMAGIDKFFSNQISITSKTGVGSSTIFKQLKKTFATYPYRFVSGGSIMRAYAAELGMTIEEFAEHNLKHPELGYDIKCDQTVATFSSQNWFISEGRLFHAFMPRAFKVLLTCDIDKRATRRQGDFPEKTHEQVIEEIRRRDAADDARYTTLYPGCLWAESDFDLVIDTGTCTLEEEERLLLEGWQEWQKKRGEEHIIKGILT